ISLYRTWDRARLFFFFQAEVGIRDGHVTGVQTCALPIYQIAAAQLDRIEPHDLGQLVDLALEGESRLHRAVSALGAAAGLVREQIGRASCRERFEGGVCYVSIKHK